MKKDSIAPFENVKTLRVQLAEHYKDATFERAMSMGQLVEKSLLRLLEGNSLV